METPVPLSARVMITGALRDTRKQYRTTVRIVRAALCVDGLGASSDVRTTCITPGATVRLYRKKSILFVSQMEFRHGRCRYDAGHTHTHIVIAIATRTAWSLMRTRSNDSTPRIAAHSICADSYLALPFMCECVCSLEF